jgi:hypothetical protein
MEIACKFKELGELEPAIPAMADDRKKLGKYSRSSLNVEGFGYKKWAIVAYIIPDEPIQEYLSDGLTEQQIVDGCIKFLNKPPTKRSRKSRYGNLECGYFNFHGEMISVSLILDQRNNKYFWGTGQLQRVKRVYSNRGRPRKKK